MKYFRILFLFSLVLFCGSVASHASVVNPNFHAGAVDPSCNANPPALPTECGFGIDDAGMTFDVGLSASQCTAGGITPPLSGLPTDPTTFGCFLGTNDTGATITSITLDFAAIPGVTGCDTNLPASFPTIFTNSACSVDPDGGFDLTFSGGGGVLNGGLFVILEEGANPDSFSGTGVVETTPEPDSLLLLSTGMMMMGLYLTGRSRLFAFLKK
ncbi:MAG: hypothetical protein ABSA39_02310 [Edaphobacter sp.]